MTTNRFVRTFFIFEKMVIVRWAIHSEFRQVHRCNWYAIVVSFIGGNIVIILDKFFQFPLLLFFLVNREYFVFFRSVCLEVRVTYSTSIGRDCGLGGLKLPRLLSQAEAVVPAAGDGRGVVEPDLVFKRGLVRLLCLVLEGGGVSASRFGDDMAN